MTLVTPILIYLAPLLICQPEIFGTISDHVSGSAGPFSLFLVSVSVTVLEGFLSVFITDDVAQT